MEYPNATSGHLLSGRSLARSVFDSLFRLSLARSLFLVGIGSALVTSGVLRARSGGLNGGSTAETSIRVLVGSVDFLCALESLVLLLRCSCFVLLESVCLDRV